MARRVQEGAGEESEHLRAPAAEYRSGQEKRSGEICRENGENYRENGENYCTLLAGTGASTSWLYLVAFRQDTRNVHNVACSAPKCDFGAEKTPE